MRVEVIRRVSFLGAVLASSALHALYQFSADVADLTKSSELVVIGEVREIVGQRSQWRAAIQIEETFKGPAMNVVTVWTTGEDSFVSASVGQRFVLFLQPSSIGGPGAYEVLGRGRAHMELMSNETGVIVRVPWAVRLPSSVTRLKEPNRTDNSVLVKLEDVRALIKSALPPPGSSGSPTLPNNAVNATVRSVTPLAQRASVAPVRPARYRYR